MPEILDDAHGAAQARVHSRRRSRAALPLRLRGPAGAVTFHFRPAVREGVSLLIGLAGGTGSGKTYTAMRLAKGIAGETAFAVIDTEAGRAKHYADLFHFDHGDLKPPFTPAAYTEAIRAADTAGYPVIVVDSFSHEHAGEGGILDMQEAEYQRMGARDAVKMTSWIKPKGEHRKMVAKLLQVRAHLILCFRAEEKIEMVRNAKGEMEVRKKVTATGLDGWVPIAEKNLPYELTASFLLLASKPGVPLPIKCQEQHRSLFPLDTPITEESGRKIAEWARGGTERPATPADSAGRQKRGAPPISAEKPKVLTDAGDWPAPNPAEQARLIADCKRLGTKLKLSKEDKNNFTETYVGVNDLTLGSIEQLTQLVNALRTRAGEAPWG
jgi:hypothetical protein